jgi:ribosomal protein L40E
VRADPATPEPDLALCPKCGAPRAPRATACAGCGLTVARIAAYTAARDAAVPDAMRDAWTRATERWNDAAVHDELLRLVVANNGYAWAAGRYRARERDAVAERQLERLRRAAEVTLMASATARRDEEARPYRAVTSVLAVLIAVIIAGLLYAMIRDRGAPATAGPPPSAPPHTVQPLQPGHPVSSSTIK